MSARERDAMGIAMHTLNWYVSVLLVGSFIVAAAACAVFICCFSFLLLLHLHRVLHSQHTQTHTQHFAAIYTQQNHVWKTETRRRERERQAFKMVVLFVFGLLLIISKRREWNPKTVCADAAAAAAAVALGWCSWFAVVPFNGMGMGNWKWNRPCIHSFIPKRDRVIYFFAQCTAQQPQNIWQMRKHEQRTENIT